MFKISRWFVTVEPLEDKHFRKSEDVFLAVIIDFIPYKVSLILSILASEYWLQQLVSAFLRNVDNMYKSIYIYLPICDLSRPINI